MKFSEMPYKRIDMEEVEKEYKSIIERTKNAKSGEEQFEIHREYYKFTADVQTSMELAMIRHDIDTTDEFYEKESDFYDEVGPIISQYENEYGKVLYDSPYRDYLESKIGKVTFKNIEIANKAFDEKIIPLMPVSYTHLTRVVRTNLPISQQISPQTNPQTKLLTAITKSSSTENKSLHNM